MSSNGDITVAIPAGAFSIATPVTVVEVVSAPSRPAQAIRVAPYFRFEPDGTILSVPAKATIRYKVPVSHFQVGAALAPYTNLVSLDERLGAWQSALTAVDAGTATFTGIVTHFSYWTGTVVQPHGVPATTANYCQSICHNLVAGPADPTPIVSKDKQVCYNCHGNTAPDLGPAGATGPNIQAEFLDYATPPFDLLTQSRHPVAEAKLYCVNCHNQHRKPTERYKLLRAKDAVTGLYVEPAKNNPYVGNAYCWACHGIQANATIQEQDPGYYERTGGDKKTQMSATPHQTNITAPTISGIKCLGCHTDHGSPSTSLIATTVAGKTTSNDKSLCFACHEAQSSGYPTSTRISSESTNAGYPISGTWPGKVAYNAGAHSSSSVVYPDSENAGGACVNCHGPHGTGRLDMLADTYDSPKSYEAGQSHNAYAMCIGACHDSNGPGPDIRSLYATDTAYAGHKIKYNPKVIESSSTAILPQGAKLPCYECHNPHGSTKDNYKMAPDEISSDTTVTNQRTFCTRCHRESDSSDSTPAVAGIRLKGLPNTVTQHSSLSGASCTSCHGDNAHTVAGHGSGGGVGCTSGGCHGSSASHLIHTSSSDARGPSIACADCHGASPTNYRVFADGQPLATTTVCSTCHSPGGSYDGLVSTGGSVGAKDNWSMETTSLVYTDDRTQLKTGKAKWCIGCHDQFPSVIGTQTAPNKAGDDVTYGYYASGHGKETSFAVESWQATTDSGNRAADKSCTSCHDLSKYHINTGVANHRMKTGFDDVSNSNCRQCHDSGKEATSSPTWYTNYAGFAASAHKDKNCTDCHDVHGIAGAYTAMTKGDKEALCNTCHSGHGGHAIDASFGRSGKSYTLQCASCHNVHLVTGVTTTSTPNVSAITLFTDNTRVWGDASGEKMQDYAGGTRYRTPLGDSMSPTQTPDYPTFCLDCHGSNMSPSIHGNISWGDVHGTAAADAPNGGGTPPDWYNVGMAEGWSGDDNSDSTNNWPVVVRGRGEQLWTRPVYNQEERIAGVNFVLSCSDCHATHASGSGKLRSIVNGNTYTGEWKTLCNDCHYYYSDWHAGMSCGAYNDCHTANIGRNGVPNGPTIHGMPNGGHGGGARAFNRDLVADMKFDNNNLDDSGSWRMHGTWRVTSGSFVAGKSGQAIQVDDDPVEIGTRNEYWSTDDGKHGTWRATEMKYRTTVEAWVYPTDDSVNERQIVTKRWSMDGFMDGGYELTLKKVRGTLRAGFAVNVNGGGQYGVWDSDSNGIRGAFSAVSVPLNRWTHIAGTFDTDGPDRNPSDQSVGRIRVYVDGEDVTDSYPTTSQTYSEPGPGETGIFPYSQHSLFDDNIPGSPNYRLNPWGYDGHWTATPLSIGGFNWSSPSNNFIGRLDEVKIWNITKPAGYFQTFDQQQAPRISTATGTLGSNQLSVRFSEGVYANPGGTGNLQPSDFVLTDADNGRTITDVTHTAGSVTATLTLSSVLDDNNDLNTDTVAPAVNSVYDEYSNAAPSTAVTITPTAVSPAQAVFNLNEAPGSTYVWDSAYQLSGRVYGSGTLTGSEFSGDGSANYIDFPYSDAALQADTTMTLEARIKPTGLSGVTGVYIRRVLGRGTGNGNWQMSVWRQNDATNWPNYAPAAGEASIAFWVRVNDNHGYDWWKPVLTEASDSGSPEYHPIVSDHWYKAKVVWNTYKAGGTLNQPFVPADIYLDDQGTDGNGAGERWSGYVNATDTDQSQFPAAKKLYTQDSIRMEDGLFRIGANTPGLGNYFNGLIDWITWKNTAD